MGGNGKHRWKISIYRSKSPKKKDPQREFLCPISGCLMSDPVVVTSCQTFEREVAEKPKMLFSHASTELNHRACHFYSSSSEESVIANVPATPLLSFATRPGCYSSTKDAADEHDEEVTQPCYRRKEIGSTTILRRLSA
ncbi:hypothetical protein RJ640_003656 [Escallonia rubra]|uniref:U-box domain-containing protein n=1 Tax=Escallonia rubra TaxID=112253 RepID=A0AA88UF22_9ASTE|nr:hypothetical protein RJ640_003656 [Escallonia rubra]